MMGQCILYLEGFLAGEPTIGADLQEMNFLLGCRQRTMNHVTGKLVTRTQWFRVDVYDEHVWRPLQDSLVRGTMVELTGGLHLRDAAPVDGKAKIKAYVHATHLDLLRRGKT